MWKTFKEWLVEAKGPAGINYGKSPSSFRNMAAPAGYDIHGQQEEDPLTRATKTFAGTVASAIGQNIRRKRGDDIETGEMSVFDTTSMFQQQESLDGRYWRFIQEVPLPEDRILGDGGMLDQKKWNSIKRQVAIQMADQFRKKVYQMYLEEGLEGKEAIRHIGQMYPKSGPTVGNPYQGEDDQWYTQVTVYFPKPGRVDDVLEAGNPETSKYQDVGQGQLPPPQGQVDQGATPQQPQPNQGENQ